MWSIFSGRDATILAGIEVETVSFIIKQLKMTRWKRQHAEKLANTVPAAMMQETHTDQKHKVDTVTYDRHIHS